MQVTVFSEQSRDSGEAENNDKRKNWHWEVIARLKKEYPDAGCTLDYDQAWKLLVSVRLAAQCTDARVNVVVEELYAEVSGCGIAGGCRTGGDRGDRPAVWT